MKSLRRKVVGGGAGTMVEVGVEGSTFSAIRTGRVWWTPPSSTSPAVGVNAPLRDRPEGEEIL